VGCPPPPPPPRFCLPNARRFRAGAFFFPQVCTRLVTLLPPTHPLIRRPVFFCSVAPLIPLSVAFSPRSLDLGSGPVPPSSRHYGKFVPEYACPCFPFPCLPLSKAFFPTASEKGPSFFSFMDRPRSFSNPSPFQFFFQALFSGDSLFSLFFFCMRRDEFRRRPFGPTSKGWSNLLVFRPPVTFLEIPFLQH